MAIEPRPDPLDRARQAARDEEPDGWIELSQSIMSRVRSVVTPAEPVLAHTAGGQSTQDDAGSRTWVSSRILTAALRRSLQQPTHAPVAIDLRVIDERLAEVELSLVCSYGLDLIAVAAAARAAAYAEIVAILGPDPDFGPADVAVHIADVVVGNPNLV